MKWEKLGLIFTPDHNKWWMATHASLPSLLHLTGDRYRVFFASRDAQQRSHVGYFELGLEDPTNVLAVSDEPVLSPGPTGHFDEHGVYAASLVKHGTEIRMYTIGWNRGIPEPLFHASVGMAVSRDDGHTFKKHGVAPIMSRSDHDPCFVSAPFVTLEDRRWRMWYLSGVGWELVDGELHSRYHVKYAESPDGIDWVRGGTIAIEPADDAERNIARACVLKTDDGYEAWFSSDRGFGYQIHHAISPDGVYFRRSEENILARSSEGWDSEAVAYPYVVNHAGNYYMFYNGNAFGRDGIGLAVADG